MPAVAMFHVADVEASSRWYQEVLGAKSGHGGPDFEMILDAGDELLLQLHRLDGHEHGPVTPATGERLGAGVLLYIGHDKRSDLDDALGRARAIDAKVISEPTWIELAHHTEMVLRDPDGYLVALTSPR